jgi:hypothetical protein
MNIVQLIIPLGAFAMIFGIVYIAITTHHRQKMAMIEAGMNPKDEDEGAGGKNLKNALLFILVPIGILVGRMMNEPFGLEKEESAIIFAFIFGGIAFGLNYLIQQRKLNNQ